MTTDRSELPAAWTAAGVDSDLGLWWLADDVREAMGDGATESDVRATTLRLLRPLLEARVLTAVDFHEGGRFTPRLGNAAAQLERILREWRALPCSPTASATSSGSSAREGELGRQHSGYFAPSAYTTT